MFRRLGFSKRLLVLILLVLFAAWALGAGSAFVWRSKDGPRSPSIPFPEQTAAIVELLDTADRSQRALLLKAISSDTFAVTIEQQPPLCPIRAGACRGWSGSWGSIWSRQTEP